MTSIILSASPLFMPPVLEDGPQRKPWSEPKLEPLDPVSPKARATKLAADLRKLSQEETVTLTRADLGLAPVAAEGLK